MRKLARVTNILTHFFVVVIHWRMSDLHYPFLFLLLFIYTYNSVIVGECLGVYLHFSSHKYSETRNGVVHCREYPKLRQILTSFWISTDMKEKLRKCNELDLLFLLLHVNGNCKRFFYRLKLISPHTSWYKLWKEIDYAYNKPIIFHSFPASLAVISHDFIPSELPYFLIKR